MSERKTRQNKKISVLFATTNLNFNGAKKYMVEVANELAIRGNKVGILFDSGPLAQKIDEKVTIYHIKLSGLGLDPISRLKTIIRSAFIANREGYEIIHGEASSSIISHKWLSLLSKARIVETIHQIWIKPKDKIKAARILPSRADILIAISSSVAKVMNEVGLNLRKVRVIQNGIDTKQFEGVNKSEVEKLRHILGIAKGDLVLVWVSRVSREKRLEAFINWFPYILSNYPRTKFVIVGDNGSGDRRYLDLIIEKTKSLGLSKNIICVGGKTEVKNYLALGDIFTITTLARDLSVMEAMAMELPVVVGKLNYAYKPELVVNESTGLLFELGNWRQWAENIKYLLGNPKVAREYGKIGKRRINSLFTIERYCDDLEKIYQEALKA
jgi:glycosyltransferase involved in cell wall biosynthesis